MTDRPRLFPTRLTARETTIVSSEQNGRRFLRRHPVGNLFIDVAGLFQTIAARNDFRNYSPD